MSAERIRRQFLEFFESKRHTFVESSPVVPHDDPTLMFTNAGMNQFKPIFLGTMSPSDPFAKLKRAVNSQKCIRAGGKHNDLDDVGKDTYHHTFFEMLGNWSFGDYFKKEAIEWAWELLTKVWGIDASRLHATYFQGDPAEGLEPDSEARDLWAKVTSINPKHIHPGNKKDNFWEMGESGPCGPCSEIHIDLTPDKSGGPLVNAGDARVMEMWNLVFIQFNRGSDGKLTPLPAKHVDTGMGFERLCSVLQGMKAGRIGQFSNYDTDVFTPIFAAIRKRTGAPEYKGTLPSEPRASARADFRTPIAVEPNASAGGASRTSESELKPEIPRGLKSAARDDGNLRQVMIDVSYRVIADHIRTLTFAITDGATPSNEGRGYVLRRILRRAVRYGRQYLDMHEPFLCDLVQPLVDSMGNVFPELRKAHGGKNVQHVTDLLRDEEASFLKTLDRGMRLFDEAADYAQTHHHGRISGEAAFKLHDTYGFPIDLTEQMAEERGLTVDIGEYERLMEEARVKARGRGFGPPALFMGRVEKWSLQDIPPEVVECLPPTDDDPKHQGMTGVGTLISAIRFDAGSNRFAPFEVAPSDVDFSEAALIFDRTCFYAEQGGQVGDTGELRMCDSTLKVKATAAVNHRILHRVTVSKGMRLQLGQSVTQFVDSKRAAIQSNHTATHLLNWALREVLGEHVQQKGSLVDPEKTRFDFSHPKHLSPEEMAQIERLVNEQIRRGYDVFDIIDGSREVDQKKAREINTLRAVFGEKYPDRVRVVSIGADIKAMLADPKNPKWMQYSVEFCGGTHLSNSKEAEEFILVSEEAVAKGVRRVVGVTADVARRARGDGDVLLERAAAIRRGIQLSTALPPLSKGGAQGGVYDVSRLLRDLAEAVIPIQVRHGLADQIAVLQEYSKGQEKQAAREAGRGALDAVAELLETKASNVGGVTVLVGEVPQATADHLRAGIDFVRNKKGSSAVLLATVEGEKVTLVAGMSKDVVDRGIKAGDLIKEISPLVGGKGGGRPDLAQGGGTAPEGLGNSLERALVWISTRLG